MALDVSAASLVRSGTGVFQVALAIFILTRRPLRAPSLSLGVALGAFGAGVIAYNLVGANSPTIDPRLGAPALVATTALSLTGVAAMSWWVAHLLQGLPPWAKGTVLMFPIAGILGALAWLPGFLDYRMGALGYFGAPAAANAAALDGVAYIVVVHLEVALGVAAVARSRWMDDPPARRLGLLLLATPFMADATATMGYWAWNASSRVDAFGAGPSLAAYWPVVVAAAMWVGARGRGGRLTPLGLVPLATMAAVVVASALRGGGDGGTGAIAVLAGTAGAAWAILRLDLLGVAMPSLVIRRGLAASLGLAVLFIVAQVAQNFFSERLGLLVGGIVAGAAVFALFPLQRWAEDATRRPGGAAERYRRQVRLAWMDGRLGANERLMLADLRRQLGLADAAALAIEDEVAREMVQTASRPRTANG